MTLRDVLAGGFDTHLHASPDIVPRRLDFLEAAALAETSGMAGLVFKDLSASTVDRAYATTQLFPALTVYGGIVLDGPVGGLNPFAVEAAFQMGGRLVWMPVVDARNTIERYLTGAIRLPIPPRRSLADGLTVLDPNGKITATVQEIIRLIADFDGVLATGHLGPGESLPLLKAAKAAGVKRMVVTHPVAKIISASISEQQAMAELGAVLEHCAAQSTSGLDGLPVTRIAESIAAVGPEHCIIASDLGQTSNPPFVDGLVAFLSELEQAGVTRNSLEAMVRTNPHRLLN